MVFRLLVDFALLILIWLVQLIIYPSFQYMTAAQLAVWHPKYTSLISYFVGPLMLAQIIAIGWLLKNDFSWLTLMSAILVGVAWLSTAFQAVPLHNAIDAGNDVEQATINLIQVNWLRTGLWSIVFLLGIAELFIQLNRK